MNHFICKCGSKINKEDLEENWVCPICQDLGLKERVAKNPKNIRQREIYRKYQEKNKI